MCAFQGHTEDLARMTAVLREPVEWCYPMALLEGICWPGPALLLNTHIIAQ